LALETIDDIKDKNNNDDTHVFVVIMTVITNLDKLRFSIITRRYYSSPLFVVIKV